MPRYRLTLEYDGAQFCGWQRQSNGLSVQQVVETAIRAFSGETVGLTAAGRTDAGVHATGQVAHLDMAREISPERLMGAVNAHLRPYPVVLLDARAVALSFHARFDAIARCYVYRILDRRAAPTLDRGRVWHVTMPLDSELMHAAAQQLVGRHDFTSYRAAECQSASPVKSLDRLYVRRAGEQILVTARARSFLHHQVRNIVGTLKLIGAGREPVRFAAEVLAARDRRRAGQTAPAAGLCLVQVDYAS